NTDDLFVGKTLLHGDVLMWLMKTLLTSGCTNQRGAGQPHAGGVKPDKNRCGSHGEAKIRQAGRCLIRSRHAIRLPDTGTAHNGICHYAHPVTGKFSGVEPLL
ncbi:hypothetical protein MWR31_18355, partial [Enterobacter hormaechei]